MLKIINRQKLMLLTLILFATGCTQTFLLLSPDDLYAIGNSYLAAENYRKASEKFEQIRNDYPTSKFATMSQFKLAQSEYERGNYEDAAIEFKLFLEFHPAHKMAPQAQYYIALSKFHSISSPERDTIMAEEAKKELEEFLTRFPEHPDLEKVREYLNEVIDHLQKHEIEVAKVYFRRGSYDAAIGRLERVENSRGSTHIKTEATLLMARTYEKKDDYEKALEYYEKVFKMDSDSDFNKSAEKGISRVSRKNS